MLHYIFQHVFSNIERIVNCVDFFSNSFSAIGRSLGSIWTYLQTTFQYLYFRVSHWLVPHWWCISAQFAYEADPYLSLHKHSEWVCHLSSIHISCMWHSWILACLIINAYSMALIGIAESQEDAPFSIALFMCCCSKLYLSGQFFK